MYLICMSKVHHYIQFITRADYRYMQLFFYRIGVVGLEFGSRYHYRQYITIHTNLIRNTYLYILKYLYIYTGQCGVGV